MERLRTLKLFEKFKIKNKKLKTYSGWCPFKGLFNDTTLMQIQSGRTVPLIPQIYIFVYLFNYWQKSKSVSIFFRSWGGHDARYPLWRSRLPGVSSAQKKSFKVVFYLIKILFLSFFIIWFSIRFKDCIKTGDGIRAKKSEERVQEEAMDWDSRRSNRLM